MNKLELLADGIKQEIIKQCGHLIDNGIIIDGEVYNFSVTFGFASGGLNLYSPQILGLSPNSVTLGKPHYFKEEENVADTQSKFALNYGINVSDRIAPELLALIAEKLMGATIDYQGKLCDIKQLGQIKQDEDGSWYLTFDVKNPVKGFEHVEFTISKTGWEMNLMSEEETKND